MDEAVTGGELTSEKVIDKKPSSNNSYSYNSISLAKKDVLPTPSASQMLTDPLYNRAAKALGVDTVHSWNNYSEKVAKLVDWAKKETGYTDNEKLVGWLYSQLKSAPSMGSKRIDDLYIFSRLKTPTKARTITKTVVKKVYVKQKMSQEDMVNRLIQGI